MKNIRFNLVALFIIALALLTSQVAEGQSASTGQIRVSTDFVSGGGTVNVISSHPAIIRFKPHNEGAGGWGQVWWYFKVEGLTPGEEITLQLDNEPANVGISPQVEFSYDQELWGLTNTGEYAEVEGRKLFVYNHIVRNEKIWFAYDLPYTPEHMQKLLFPKAAKDPNVEVFELCKTRAKRPVMALRFDDPENSADKKYGIWLQARDHAFETGGSWVLHELTQWLLSDDPAAKALRSCASITVVPIVDVDAVVEGRTGKNQAPHDHNRGWFEDPAYWIEVQTIKTMLSDLSKQNKVDLFMDFHGPGGLSHPYFIVPFSHNLLFEKQQYNRAKFFEILNAKALDDDAKKTQSMTQIHYSERPPNINNTSSTEWVRTNTNEQSITLTLEVNMNTPLSTNEGYRAEALKLGHAISEYFINDYHLK